MKRRVVSLCLPPLLSLTSPLWRVMLKLTYSFSCLSTVIEFIAVASIHQRLQDTSRGRIDLQMPRDQIQVPHTDYAIAHTQCMTEYITGQTAGSWNSNCCNDKVICPLSPLLLYRWRAKLLAISICWQSFCFAGSLCHSCNRIRLECHSSPHRCHTLVHLPTTCPYSSPLFRHATQGFFPCAPNEIV